MSHSQENTALPQDFGSQTETWQNEEKKKTTEGGSEVQNAGYKLNILLSLLYIFLYNTYKYIFIIFIII